MLIRVRWYTIRGVTTDLKGEDEFLVETDYVDHLKNSGQLDKWKASPVIKDVLQRPTSIFRGLQRPGNPRQFSEGLIYCGKPTECFGENGSEPPPENEVLAVYIVFNAEHECLHAFDWDWKEEDKDYPGFPKSWDKDYGEPLWPPPTRNA